MSAIALSPEDLEGRLIAQRRVIQWLLACTVRDKDALDDLVRHVSAMDPILDQQEDPGAVPTMAFAAQGAATAELRLILAPIEAQFDGRDRD